MNLTFSAYQDTDISQFSVDDAIVEMLESDNLTLQNLLGGKYVQVRPWQARLGLPGIAGWQERKYAAILVFTESATTLMLSSTCRATLSSSRLWPPGRKS